MSEHNAPSAWGEEQPATWPDLAYWRDLALRQAEDLAAQVVERDLNAADGSSRSGASGRPERSRRSSRSSSTNC